MASKNVHQDSLVHSNDFELHDFIDDPNFDQFINLIRGENEDPICNFDPDLINGCFLDNYQFPSCHTNPLFDYSNSAVSVYDQIPNSSTLSSFSFFDGELKGGGDEENDGEGSSATTITTTTPTTSANSKPRPKADRSKTLISERRRRGRMKDKLYALRSLVPNITKMDKASIIGDALSYVDGLQAQAKKLKAEVAGLEASLLASENYQGSVENPMKLQGTQHPISKKIVEMEVIQVEESGFYVKLVSNKGEGVASSLYKALESLAGFTVQNSNLATVSDRFQLTLTLKVKVSEAEINLPNLKLWVAGALLNQGFEFLTYFPV